MTSACPRRSGKNADAALHGYVLLSMPMNTVRDHGPPPSGSFMKPTSLTASPLSWLVLAFDFWYHYAPG